MKIINFRANEITVRHLDELVEKWNDEEEELRNLRPYTRTDVITSCIAIIYANEFIYSQNCSLTNKYKTAKIKE